MDNAHNNIIADVARGASKLALTGKARLAPACLRQAVKASFDAPALGQCVTSVKNLKYNVDNNNLPKPHAMLIIRPDQMQSFTDRISAQFAAKLTGQLQADYPRLFQPLPPPLALRMVSAKIDYAEYRYEIRFQSALTVFLSRADLPRANLSGANLSGADLIEADLIEANLSDADLSDADLSGSDLSGSDLRGADLMGADFYEVIK